jgi:uncharacterized Ntn-hydrolase superfamily protein
MARAFEMQRGELVGKLFAAVFVLRPNGGYLGLSDVHVDTRVDNHPEPAAELRRIFRMWELVLLQRDDPSDVVVKKDVVAGVQSILRRLGCGDREGVQGGGPAMRTSKTR